MSFSSEEESQGSTWNNDIMYGRKSVISDQQISSNSKPRSSISSISSKSSKSTKSAPFISKELKRLENENKELRKQVENHQKSIFEFQQIASKSNDLMKENDALQDNLTDLVASKSIAEFQLQQMQKEQRSLTDGINEKQTSLQVDNNILRQQLQMAQQRIIDLEDTVNKLNQESIIIKQDQEKGKEEIERLTAKTNAEKAISATNREIELLAKTQKEVEQQAIVIIEYQKQFRALAQTLDIKLTGSMHDDWRAIIDTVVDIKYIAGRVTQVEAENQRLENDKKIAVDELNAIQSRRTSKSSSFHEDGVKEALQRMLHQERQVNEENSELIEKLKSKASYASIIENALHYTITQINDLHAAISNTYQGGFKTLIFTVILARKFVNKNDLVAGVNGIKMMFGNKSSSSFEGKIKNLRIAYSRLTEDLILAKADLEKSEEKRKKLKEKVVAYQQLTITTNDSTSKYEKKCRGMKRKIEDLQKEIESMVTPALYESTVKSLEEENKRSQQFQITIKQLEESNRMMEREIQEMKLAAENADVKLNTAKANIQKLSNDIASRDKDNDLLQRLLRVKSKEIISLERVVHRQESIQATNENEIKLLAGSNSSHSVSNVISFDPYSLSRPRLNSQSGAKESINKAFICN